MADQLWRLGSLGDFLLDKLIFRKALAEQLDLGMGPNCSYGDWQIFGLIVIGYPCGQDRLAHVEELSKDPTAQHLLGLGGPIKKLENDQNILPCKEPVRLPAEGN